MIFAKLSLPLVKQLWLDETRDTLHVKNAEQTCKLGMLSPYGMSGPILMLDVVHLLRVSSEEEHSHASTACTAAQVELPYKYSNGLSTPTAHRRIKSHGDINGG